MLLSTSRDGASCIYGRHFCGQLVVTGAILYGQHIIIQMVGSKDRDMSKLEYLIAEAKKKKKPHEF
jgi:hypothetical protein